MTRSLGARAPPAPAGNRLNSEPEHCEPTNENYNTNGQKHNPETLCVILPDVPPTFDPPAATALLRLLLDVRDRRRTLKNIRQMESE
ncbi:hypothetical protein GA0070216_10146 [Micromonospora matsumotoense]|uniref:Uncharacterized protein n=1 Tax=Micromonospora matsumotoense TaxID=121616 RepID=A0A1C4TWU6_9ACTN|nr:hypothetical protein GA0070216_10146 [Micromonospora matsumotoense]